MMSEMYFHFRKILKGKDIVFPLRKTNCIHVLWKYFSNYVFLQFLKNMYKTLAIKLDFWILDLILKWDLETYQMEVMTKYFENAVEI